MRQGPRTWSLQRRLALTLTAAVAALWLAGTAGAAFVLRRETDEVFDSALREVAERVLPLAYAEMLSRETTEAQRVATVGPKAEHISYVVRDVKGVVLLQSSDADIAKSPNNPPLGFTTTDRAGGLIFSPVSAVRRETVADTLCRVPFLTARHML